MKCWWCDKPLSYGGAARLRINTPKGDKPLCGKRCADAIKHAAEKAVEVSTPESREKVR